MLRRIALALLAAGIGLVSLEISARLYWRIQYGVPLLEPARIRTAFYPNVERIRADPPVQNDGVQDVLVLGGSVIDETRDRFEEVEARLDNQVRFHVGAKVAHTTLDSRRKFEWMEDLPFDEVLVYHGINDCKYNNVPPERFDSDYSAYPFYRVTRDFLASPPSWTVAPFTWRYLEAKGGVGGEGTVERPTAVARRPWFRFGEDVKSRATFRANLEDILDRAAARGIPVRIASFVVYLPDDYDEQTFLETGYDYAEPRLRAGVWGEAEDIVACVAEHNRILVELAQRYPDVELVEMRETVPAAGWAFNDPCHFSEPGEEVFFGRFAEVYRGAEHESGGVTPRSGSGYPGRGQDE